MVRIKRGKPKSNLGTIIISSSTAIGALIAIVWIFDLQIGISLTNHQPQHEEPSQQQLQQQLQTTFVPDLTHEPLFLKTIKSCIPAEENKKKSFNPKKPKCGEYIAPGDQKRQRIAFMAPPGHVAHQVAQLLQTLAQQHEARAVPSDYPMDIISTTHVPPYGYGKTHGWTKMIRLHPSHLPLQVADLLSVYQQSHSNTGESPDISELKIVLKQILRFHCRLSHVSAHTALLTLSVDDLILSSSSSPITQLLEFLAPHEDGWGHASMETHTRDLLAAVQHVRDEATRLLPSGWKESLDQALQEELKLSKDMTVWPCPSFWALDDSSLETPLTRFVAEALSPNCSDPLANCWVARDKCEAAGDAVCAKKK